MAEQDKARRYGKCLVEREIGRGARATVFLAWHESLQIPVAVKVISKENALDDEHFSERFMREARIAAQLSHSHIVRVYDCGETETDYYLVMEYVEGESCKDKMEQWGAFDWQRGIEITRQIAEGLRYASRKGIIHRDIKPENIMIGNDGDARIADLGLAKQVVTGRGSATADGDVLGTPYYMSPEQVRQPSDVDFRSDVYSLGATLYHMVTGEVPFEAPTPYEIMTKHLNEPVKSPGFIRPELPAALCDFVVRSMAKDPADRFGDYDELIAGLDLIMDVPAAAPTDEDVMAAVEASIDDSAVIDKTARAATAEPAPRPKVRPIRPVELPVTTQNVTTKLLGVLSVLAYVFWIVLLYQYLVDRSIGIALASMVGVLLISVGWGYACARRDARPPDEGTAPALDDELSVTLGRLCERLELPTPRTKISHRVCGAPFAYSFFSRRSRVYLPDGWLHGTALTDKEREALLAHALAGVYTGDADLRTVLAVPIELLKLGRFSFCHLVGLAKGWTPTGRERGALALAVAVLVSVCAAVAALFAVSLVAGVLAALFFGLLLLVSAFERSSRLVADGFAARVVDSSAAVRSLIVAQGLASLEARRLILETEGHERAARWDGELPAPSARSLLTEGIAAHYGEVEFSPGTFEMGLKLFSVVPFAADRLNALAGIPRRRSLVMAVAQTVKRLYAGLLGADEKDGVCMVDLANVGADALSGALGGVLSVIVMTLLALVGRDGYGPFVATVAVLSVTLGAVVAAHVCRQGPSAGRMGWSLAAACVAFSATAMLGLCIPGGKRLASYAPQYPIALIPILTIAAGAAAAFVRLGPALGVQTQGRGQNLGSKTAHTLIIPSKEQKLDLKSIRSRRDRTRPPDVEEEEDSTDE